MTEYVLWAVKRGDEDWQEQIITTCRERRDAAKQWATQNGFDRFRECEVNLDTPPDFRSTLNTNKQGSRQ